VPDIPVPEVGEQETLIPMKRRTNLTGRKKIRYVDYFLKNSGVTGFGLFLNNSEEIISGFFLFENPGKIFFEIFRIFFSLFFFRLTFFQIFTEPSKVPGRAGLAASRGGEGTGGIGGSKGGGRGGGGVREYVIRTADLVYYMKEALSIATDTCNLFLILKSYLVMAEVQYINDDLALSKEFFGAFRDQYVFFSSAFTTTDSIFFKTLEFFFPRYNPGWDFFSYPGKKFHFSP
jgi:hypothetical protein